MTGHMIIAKDYDDLSRRAALAIAGFIRTNPDALLCLAAGDTPLGTFRELIRLQSEGSVDLSSVYYAGLDEWVGLGPDDTGSCRQVMRDNFYAPARIPMDRIHVFDGLDDPAAQYAAMNAWLRARGAIGLALLGIGMNGHVGFNEPGTPEAEGALVISLDEVTKKISEKYFDKKQPVTKGITIGLTTLMKARQTLIIASGENKAPIVKQAFCEPKSKSVPASVFQDHPELTLLLDEAAAKSIAGTNS